MDKSTRILTNILICLIIFVITILGFGGEYIFKKLQYEVGYNFSGGFSKIDTFEARPSTFEQNVEVYVNKDGKTIRPVPFRTKAFLKNPKDRNENEKKEAEKYVKDGIDKDVKNYKIEKRVIKDNPKEVVTYENVDKSQDIMMKTLKQLGYTNFSVRINKEDASITFSIPQVYNNMSGKNDLNKKERKDIFQSIIEAKGGFEIVDTQTGKVLLDEKDIVNSSVRKTDEAGVLLLEFSNKGSEKLKNITSSYVKKSDKEIHQVDLKLNGITISRGEFKEPIVNGKLPLSLVKLDKNELKNEEKLKELVRLNLILKNGRMPIKYTMGKVKQDVFNIVNMQNLKIFAIILMSVLIFMALSLLIFKVKGLLSLIIFLGYIGAVLLLVRFTNIQITPEAVIGFFLTIVFNYYLLVKINLAIKKDENPKVEFLKALNIFIPFGAVSVFLATAIDLNISTFAMMIFISLLITLIHYNLFTRILMLGGNNEENY